MMLVWTLLVNVLRNKDLCKYVHFFTYCIYVYFFIVVLFIMHLIFLFRFYRSIFTEWMPVSYMAVVVCI